MTTRRSHVLQHAARGSIPELTRLATTIETWWPAVEAFLRLRVTNARTEGYNTNIKLTKRISVNRLRAFAARPTTSAVSCSPTQQQPRDHHPRNHRIHASPRRAVKFAREMSGMSDVSAKKLVKDAADQPETATDQLIEEAKTGGKVTQIIVTLSGAIHAQLQRYAVDEATNQDDAAAQLIEDGLNGRGYGG